MTRGSVREYAAAVREPHVDGVWCETTEAALVGAEPGDQQPPTGAHVER